MLIRSREKYLQDEKIHILVCPIWTLVLGNLHQILLYIIYFLMKLDIRWEIQPVTIGGCRYRFTLAPDVSVLRSSVHCSVVTLFRLADENEWFEKICKVNLATLMSSVLYRVTRMEQVSTRIQPPPPPVA
jgi:hypothetical protein